MKATMFKDDMLKAVLENKKTQTRRLDGLQEINKKPDQWDYTGHFCTIKDGHYFQFIENIYPFDIINVKPKYKEFDIIGIKENFKVIVSHPEKRIQGVYDNNDFFDSYLTEKEWNKFTLWKTPFTKKSKLFMFDSLIRHKIKITNIRPERIKDISDNDIIKEGVSNGNRGDRYIDFCNLWDSINKERGYGWDKNNWVFVYEFKRIEV
jgi:hypothetical protein